ARLRGSGDGEADLGARGSGRIARTERARGSSGHPGRREGAVVRGGGRSAAGRGGGELGGGAPGGGRGAADRGGAGRRRDADRRAQALGGRGGFRRDRARGVAARCPPGPSAQRRALRRVRGSAAGAASTGAGGGGGGGSLLRSVAGRSGESAP